MEIRRCMKCMHELAAGETACPACGRAYGSAKAEPFALKPGTILEGKYLVGEMLGQGGFGITYIGFDLLLEQKVAIKEYYPMSTGMVSRDGHSTVVWSSAMMGKTGTQKGFDSFLKEARKMAKLRSIPSVVGVNSVFIQNETAYIVMDFIEGETLLKKLQREGPMDFATCVRLMTPIMQALSEVHKHGIIHRDISPDNIMVQPDGTLILLDLGAAKDLDIQGKDGNMQSSQMVAKQGFSPIEQYWENGNVGPWTDVYAMAATIYYCCTGVLPPSAVGRVMEDSLTCQPLLTQAQFDVLAFCMGIMPQNRPQDMTTLLQLTTPEKPKAEPLMDIPTTELSPREAPTAAPPAPNPEPVKPAVPKAATPPVPKEDSLKPMQPKAKQPKQKRDSALKKQLKESQAPSEKRRTPILFGAILLTVIIVIAVWYWNAVDTITVNTTPLQTVYDFGDTLNLQGLSLEVTRNNGKKEKITEGFACSPMELTTSGTVEITATYHGKHTVFSVESIPVLSGIRVATQPEKTWCPIGTSLNFEGLTLEANYNDGSTQIVEDGFTCSPAKLTTLGNHEITVQYETQTTGFTVEAVKAEKISLRNTSSRTVYMVGEAPNPAGITLNVTYNNGKTDVIREDFTCPDTAFTQSGTQEIPISFAGAETSYTVDVLPAVTFDNMKAYLDGATRLNDNLYGYNANGDTVNWAMWFWCDLDPVIREAFTPTISCSWGDIRQSGNFETAKAGVTHVEFGIFTTRYNAPEADGFVWTLHLPDDPSIAGPQTVTLKVGCSEMTFSFTLVYEGDYKTGTGWSITDLTY